MVDWGEDQGLVYWWLCTLALAFPDIAWWVHEPRRHSGRHGGYGLDSCRRVPGLPAAEANSEPRCGTGPWDDQPASWWHTSSTGPLPPWEGQHLSLLEQILILAHNASPQPPTCGLTKSFIHHHGVQRSIASDQGTDFIAREVWAWAHVLLCSHHSEAASLIEWWNGLLKTLLKHQLSGSSLDGWGGVLQKVVCALNQSPACARYSFSHSQNPWVQDSRRWNRNGSTHCHPGDLLDDVSAIVVVHLTQHLSLSNKCVCVFILSVLFLWRTLIQ